MFFRFVTHKAMQVPVWVLKLVDSLTTFCKCKWLSNFFNEFLVLDNISQLKSSQRKSGKLQSVLSLLIHFISFIYQNLSFEGQYNTSTKTNWGCVHEHR